MNAVVDPTELQIAKYLAKGYRPTQIAQIFNMSPSHITYIQNKDGFKELVRSEAAAGEQLAQKTDDNYDSIEMLASQKIKEKIEQGFFKPTELIAVAAMANKAIRKRGAIMSDGQNGTQGISVRISLPSGLQGIEIVRTPDNQVMRVGNTSLTPVSRTALAEMAEAIEFRDKKKEESEDKPRLPISNEFKLPNGDSY